MQVECVWTNGRFALDDTNDPRSGIGSRGDWSGAEADNVKVGSLRVGRAESMFYMTRASVRIDVYARSDSPSASRASSLMSTLTPPSSFSFVSFSGPLGSVSAPALPLPV